MTIFQIRMVGPMTLANYTAEELAHLRRVVRTPGSKIKYLAFSGAKSGASDLTIYAQGINKMTLRGWRKHLGARITNVVPLPLSVLRTGIPECEEAYGCPPYKTLPNPGQDYAPNPPPPGDFKQTSNISVDQSGQPSSGSIHPAPSQPSAGTTIVDEPVDQNLVRFLHSHTSRTRGAPWPRKGCDVWDDFQQLACVYYQQTNTPIYHAHTQTIAHAIRGHPDRSIEWTLYALEQARPRPSRAIDQEMLDYLHTQPVNPLACPISAWAILSQHVTRYYNMTGKHELPNHKRTKAWAMMTHPNTLASWGVYALNMLAD